MSDGKLCPTCGMPWMRSDGPNPKMLCEPGVLFDTEAIVPGAERVFLFQRPIGQNDMADCPKGYDDTNMVMAGQLACPLEFRVSGLRWLLPPDPEWRTAGVEALAHAVLEVDHGVDRELCALAGRIPIGDFSEVVHSVVDGVRLRWRVEASAEHVYPFRMKLRWGECFCARLLWPELRPPMGFRLRLAVVGHICFPEGW